MTHLFAPPIATTRGRHERRLVTMTSAASAIGMALFGMVWLLRVRAEMKRCAKCQRREAARAASGRQATSRATSFFTIEGAATPTSGQGTLRTPVVEPPPTTFCEVHGYVAPKEDIQEFYELTLLDENKSVQEKTAETIRIANKWESNDGPIIPSFANNEVPFIHSFPGAILLHSYWTRHSTFLFHIPYSFFFSVMTKKIRVE